MTDLSVIILSFNTKDVTKQCLQALIRSFNSSSTLQFDIIVIDNASSDGSVEMLKKFETKNSFKNIRLKYIFNKKNLGYPKGNNQGLKQAEGKYILLLNSDAMVESINWEQVLNFMNKDSQIGVLTVKVKLPNGQIDPASHRGFPTIWNSFCYFSGLEKIFEKVPLLGKLFGGYHLIYKDLNSTHEIDSPTGAFFLSSKNVLDKVSGFDDKNFFLYGEDLDLAYRIKEAGYKIIYYPLFEVTHLKKISGLKKENKKIRNKSEDYFYEAMKIFYKKHYQKKYPSFVNKAIYFFIDLKKNFS